MKKVKKTKRKEYVPRDYDFSRGTRGKYARRYVQGTNLVVLAPDDKRAYVSNIGSGSLTVIDLEKAIRVKTIETGQGAEGLDISPDGSEVWVANRGEDTISIVSTESLEVVETLKCATFPIRLKFTPDGKRVLISNARSGDVAVFDAGKRSEITRIVMASSLGRVRATVIYADSANGHLECL